IKFVCWLNLLPPPPSSRPPPTAHPPHRHLTLPTGAACHGTPGQPQAGAGAPERGKRADPEWGRAPSTEQTTEGRHVNAVQGRNDVGSMGTPGRHQQTPQIDPEQRGMLEPRGAARAPQRNTSQQDRPHISASSMGDPGVTRYGNARPTQTPLTRRTPPHSNARAMQSSAGTPGATPVSTTAAMSAPQTPDACTRRHAPPLTAHADTCAQPLDPPRPRTLQSSAGTPGAA
ncbi:hypothetical protein DXG01_012678, partial [Tephrocybe rancida]